MCMLTLALAAAMTGPDDATLADYFGFSGLEVIRIGDDAGPMYVADMNGDGLQDVIVVNNDASSIDVLHQVRGRSPNTIPAIERANDIPDHWRFDRDPITVPHQVLAVAAHDFNGDHRLDLIYAGKGDQIVFLAQQPDGSFDRTRRHTIRNLGASRSGFSIADVVGDNGVELITLGQGDIRAFPLEGDALGKPLVLAAGARIVAFKLADFDGDGLTDMLGIAPDNAAPIRLWLARRASSGRTMGPQTLYEMPPLREFAAVGLPGRTGDLIAVIERSSKRVVLYEVDVEPIEAVGDREAPIQVHAGEGGDTRLRSQLLVDVDGDGLVDVVSTNPDDNTIVVHRQVPGEGLARGQAWPTLTAAAAAAACDFDGDGSQDLFVLSEEEGVVGRSPLGGDAIDFPRPMPISPGRTPVSLQTVELDGTWRVAVISRDKRNYALDLLSPDGSLETIDLGSLSRGPDEMLAFDADQDSDTDLLLLTRDKPMKMLRADEDGFSILDEGDMGQYGLVRDATAENTAIADIDGDGPPELLIADENFVRAVRYELDPGGGTSPGWQVVYQVNLEDADSDLVSITVLGDQLAAADRENDRIVLLARNGDNRWQESDSLMVRGFEFDTIHAADFSDDGRDEILAVGDAGFAIVQLAGDRVALREVQSWRTSEDRRVQHELTIGDINGDGFADMVSLDAGEQMLEIFTFDGGGSMRYVTGFEIFESRFFSGGEPREFQPSQAIIVDLTGDGRSDLLLLAHDRLLLYPQ